MTIKYHLRDDGIHVITSTQDYQFDTSKVLKTLAHLHQYASGNPCYIMMDFSTQYHLPLREFVMALKQFYRTSDSQNLRIAIVVQPSLVRVLEAVIKTLVSRDSIQYFTQQSCAIAWINIERGQNIA